MFSHLSKYNRILVTGPQRSGTRICAKMIAYDTTFSYIDEADSSTGDIAIFKRSFSSHHNSIFHCPGMCYIIEQFSYPDTLIILIHRPISDILKSQLRIKWDDSPELKKYNVNACTISRTKYDHWDNHQKQLIQNYLEIDYSSLSQHPLWIPSAKRTNFLWNQTQL